MTLGGVEMKAEKTRFYVERGSIGIQAMTILMALSVIFRIIGCWGLWNDRNYALFQIALPILSAILLILCIQILGKHALWLSFIPVLFGAIFFIIKSLGFDNRLHTILCILLYMAVIVLYFCTVFGILRTNNKTPAAQDTLIADDMRLVARKADGFHRAVPDAFIAVFTVGFLQCQAVRHSTSSSQKGAGR